MKELIIYLLGVFTPFFAVGTFFILAIFCRPARLFWIKTINSVFDDMDNESKI